MKIALAHDYLNQYGGAERVLEALCALFPHAPIYTLLYDEAATAGAFRGRTVRTSFLQCLPGARRWHYAFAPFMPAAVEQFDTSAYDVVLSVSASFIKGLVTAPHTRHVDYCLTPPRFLWDDSHKFIADFGVPPLARLAVAPALSYLRVWDRQASARVDAFLAVSDFVRRRIGKYYRRSAEVIHPPVDVEKFSLAAGPGKYFLAAGRLVAYKKFDLAIRAFNRLGLPLVVAGTGVQARYLQSIAGSNISFTGMVSDARLAELYRGAKALVFPQEEDFGIVPLEAMASGRPVIAYRGGGAAETIKEGQTGIFLDDQTEDALMAAVRAFDPLSFDPNVCRAQAEEFRTELFREKIMKALETRRPNPINLQESNFV